MCDEALLKDGTPYLIHKAFIAVEMIFEYAMSAAGQNAEELPGESLEHINTYIPVSNRDRSERCWGHWHGGPWISRLISGTD